MNIRSSGILLHITSLPSPFGIGDLGPEAYRFADFLAGARQSVWQILPLNPTGESPYHSDSAFAANPLLISPELLVRAELLDEADLRPLPPLRQDQVDFAAVIAFKEGLFERAFERFDPERDPAFRQFCDAQAGWLDDYALFKALKSRYNGAVWRDWPSDLRDREPAAIDQARHDHRRRVRKEKFLQYLFYTQWSALKRYCNRKGILIFGDIPIYVTYDSADVWTHPDLFKLDHERRPEVVAGVPPDYFSRTGQLWGNPVYNWAVLQERSYDWWIERFARNRELFDFVRIDHFRGLVAYWEVPASEPNAINGRWVEAPALDFFTTLFRRFPALPVLAEDLGLITADVREVVARFGFPGMKVLLFAFGPDMPANPYIPHNLPVNCVAYTGTHDNNTIRGWFENETSQEDKERIFAYIGRQVPVEELHWELIRLLMRSAAGMVIVPVQDLLGLGQEARMNNPGLNGGNWGWRLSPGMTTLETQERLRRITEMVGRG
ncbi:4-alpha-glucanotransferase [Desulfatiglans anilini]|uniref:4-alpha-glucanotransferase n=1 Tax=Desulfatiglans anilini TaxID=90728 RepID=UPI00040866C8|nr:4-alpha-glucanotransferase [Desulfatiglans anilini]